MIDITVVLAILFCHFVGDFVLQDDATAKNKSKHNIVLFHHVMIYSLPFCLAGVILNIFTPIWVLINITAHFITDYCTSRITSTLYKEQKIHWFFVVIGLDQLIHYVTMIVTYQYFPGLK